MTEAVSLDQKIYVGDTPLIVVDCEENISTASGTKILYRRPDGVTGEFVSTISGTDYLIYQIPDTSVITIAGEWKFQAYILSLGSWTGRGETDIYIIHEEWK